MALLRARHLTPALLAGLAAPWLGACGLDTDSEETEQSAPVTQQPPPADIVTPTDDSGCSSTVDQFGLLCTTCPDDGDAPPECLVAECQFLSPGCLTCIDGKGRAGLDCSVDPETVPGVDSTVGGGDTFDSCSTFWGDPRGSQGVCHYPSTASCVVDEEAHCVNCTYPDGSGVGPACPDPDEPLPDVMAGRPSTLPPRGECVNELGPDGAIVCSTCTRDDLSASKMCRFPPAASCDISFSDEPIETCMTCALEGGGEVEICDGAGS